MKKGHIIYMDDKVWSLLKGYAALKGLKCNEALETLIKKSLLDFKEAIKNI